MRGGPEEGAGFDHRVAVAAMGLEPMMSPAERSEVAVARGPALVVGHPVVDVAAVGGAGAPREDAGRMGQLDALAHPAADLVLLDPRVVVEVDHRYDGQPAVGATAPVTHGLGQQRTVEVAVSCEEAVAGHRVEAEVEDELGAAVRRRRGSPVQQCQGTGGVGEHAQCPRAPYVEGVRRQLGGRVLLGERSGHRGEGLVERGEVVPVGAGGEVGDATVVDGRVVDRDVARLQGGESVELDLILVEQDPRLLEHTLEPDLTDRRSHRGHVLVDVGADVVRTARHRVGDATGAVGLQRPVEHQSPVARQSVPQRQRLPDQPVGGCRRPAQGGPQTGRGVPGDRGDAAPLVELVGPVAVISHSRRPGGVRVGIGPQRGQLQQLQIGRAAYGVDLTHARQQRGRRGEGRVHAPFSLEHLFESRAWPTSLCTMLRQGNRHRSSITTPPAARPCRVAGRRPGRVRRASRGSGTSPTELDDEARVPRRSRPRRPPSSPRQPQDHGVVVA